MRFKKILLILFCALAVLAGGCKKKKKDVPDPVTPPAQEATLAITVPNINMNADNNAANGNTLVVKLNITSTPLPPQGVNVTVTATGPDGQPIAQNATATFNAATGEVTIINLPSLQVVDIVLTVTSKTKPSNTQTFRFGVMNKVA